MGVKGGWGLARTVVLTAPWLTPVVDPPTGPFSSALPSLPLPPPLDLLVSPWEGDRAKGEWRKAEGSAHEWVMDARAAPTDGGGGRGRKPGVPKSLLGCGPWKVLQAQWRGLRGAHPRRA